MRQVRFLSKLNEFHSGRPAPKGEVIDVDVTCQRCFVPVDEAEYYFVEKLLKWVCPQGHVSYIEDFRL